MERIASTSVRWNLPCHRFILRGTPPNLAARADFALRSTGSAPSRVSNVTTFAPFLTGPVSARCPESTARNPAIRQSENDGLMRLRHHFCQHACFQAQRLPSVVLKTSLITGFLPFLRLWHGRVPWSGRMRFALSCSSGCLDAGLSSSLSSGLSSVIGYQIAARRRR